MSKTNKTIHKIPEVLSVRRCAIVGDGVFHGLKDPNFDTPGKPIPVIRHGIRGTQNQNSGKTVDKVSNIQTTESAKTHPEDRAVLVSFPLRFLPLKPELSLSTCSGSYSDTFRPAYEGFIERAVESGALQTLGNRLARNLFNGRWLWRNRQLGQSVTVRVQYGNEDFQQDALRTSLRDFENYSEAEIAVGEFIASILAGQADGGMTVSALIDLGMNGSVEIYPSQNYTSNKPKGFARPLYKVGLSRETFGYGNDPMTFTDTRVMGLAALRDQKIWNAIRTIDTWYKDANQNQPVIPIPVEPLGANLQTDSIYRNKNKGSLFDKGMLSDVADLDPGSNEGLFVLACLIRGGVFGEKDKEKSKKSEETKGDE